MSRAAEDLWFTRCSTHGNGQYTEVQLIRRVYSGMLSSRCCRISIDGNDWHTPDSIPNVKLAMDLEQVPEDRTPDPTTPLQQVALGCVFVGCLATLAPTSIEASGNAAVRFGIHEAWGLLALAAGSLSLGVSLLARVVGRWLWLPCALAAATTAFIGGRSLASQGFPREVDDLSKWVVLATGAIAAVLMVLPLLLRRTASRADAGREKTSRQMSDHGTRRLGDYRLLECIGSGGMGQVYLAEHAHHSTKFALKVLPAELARDESFVARFQKEALIVTKLRHPNIVQVHYMGRANGVFFLAMDYTAGPDGKPVNLQDHIKRQPEGRLAESQAWKWALQIAEALSYAHEHGVTHRDLRPANILIDASGNAKLTDVGLAGMIGNEFILSQIRRLQGSLGGMRPQETNGGLEVLDARDTATAEPSTDSQRSMSALSLFDTYDHMAPEQRGDHGGPVDQRTDIHGFGLVLYRLLTGTRQSGIAGPPSLMTSGISRKWDAIWAKCVSADPASRYASMAELLADLRAISPRRARNVVRSLHLPAVLVLILLANLGSLVQYSARQSADANVLQTQMQLRQAQEAGERARASARTAEQLRNAALVRAEAAETARDEAAVQVTQVEQARDAARLEAKNAEKNRLVALSRAQELEVLIKDMRLRAEEMEQARDAALTRLREAERAKDDALTRLQDTERSRDSLLSRVEAAERVAQESRDALGELDRVKRLLDQRRGIVTLLNS